MASQGQSLLWSLPEELIAHIASLLSVDSLLPFALTCKTSHHQVKGRLQKQHEYAIFKIQHDRNALTVPSLLRRTIAGDDPIWHVMSFDVWATRGSFDGQDRESGDLVSFGRYDHPETVEDEGAYERARERAKEDFETLKSFFTPEEIDRFRDVMIDTLKLSRTDAEDWLQEIRDGFDEPLKGVLFALLPNLDRICFLRGDCNDEEGIEHPLKFLGQTITSISKLSGPSSLNWPLGLQSLRSISVGVYHESVDRCSTYTLTTATIAPLFKLPNIKVLNFEWIDEEDDDYEIDLPAKSSSVEELTFQDDLNMSFDDTLTFFSAPKKLIKTGGGFESSNQVERDTLLKLLVDEYSESLECLNALSFEPDTLSDMLHSLPNFKVLERLYVAQLVSDHESALQNVTYRPEVEVDLGEQYGVYKFQIVDLRSLFPQSIESVSLLYEMNARGTWDRYHGWNFDPKPFAVRQEVLRAVADLAEDERFGNLKEVCLRDLHTLVGADHEKLRVLGWDDAAVRRIEAKGIKTHLGDMERREHALLHRRGHFGHFEIESDPGFR